MTSEALKLPQDIVDQLSSLESGDDAGLHDLTILNGIRQGIGQLLEHGDEQAVRRLLRERFDGGELRQETYELVLSMLDRFVREELPTSGTSAQAEPDDAFSSTTVIEPSELSGLAPDQRLQVGSVLRDRFLLQERVSGGSMGVVYKALDRRLAEAGEERCYVAIKVLAPALADDARALRALQQEAAKGRCLVHNHIVRFMDLDRDDDLYFIVMEWLDGENLATMLDRAESISADRALQITQQVGRALDYAHRCGIVHADVKPANVMIMPGGDAKLFDFGVARVRQAREQSDFDPGELGAMTPAYSSMQVLTGEEPVPEDDVFSLACLYYRLVAGYRVFGPRNAAEAAEAGMSPQPLQGISERQWKAVRKALSFSRVARFPSVREFLEELSPRDEPISVSADDLSQHGIEHDAAGGRRWPWILAVLLAAAGATYLSGPLDGFVTEQSAPASVRTPNDEAPIAEAAAPPAGVVDPGGVRESIPNEPSPAQQVAAETPAPVAALPVGDDTLRLSAASPGRLERVITEGDRDYRIDLVRGSSDLAETFTVSMASFSGNRSPLATGDLTLDPAARVDFAGGQSRAQLVVGMRDDPLREADSTVELLIEDAGGAPLASLGLRLEDDDQRRFETLLPVNTVAFAAGQISVGENDNVVQIEIIRYRPDERSLRVGFTVSDVTATSGEDYFEPAENIIEFTPGQRSARVLIPIVKDSEVEPNEAFVVELISANSVTNAEIYERVAVMIRDDD